MEFIYLFLFQYVCYFKYILKLLFLYSNYLYILFVNTFVYLYRLLFIKCIYLFVFVQFIYLFYTFLLNALCLSIIVCDIQVCRHVSEGWDLDRGRVFVRTECLKSLAAPSANICTVFSFLFPRYIASHSWCHWGFYIFIM